MESVRKKRKRFTLRNYLITTILVTISIVIILSGLDIWACFKIRKYLLPEDNGVCLTIEQTYKDGSKTNSMFFIDYDQTVEGIPYLTDGNDSGAEPNNSKFSIEKIEKPYDTLTPKRKLAYNACGVLIVAVPIVLSIVGILFSGMFFYKRKLEKPIEILNEATTNIANQNLDFTVEYAVKDEMGSLCQSFEQMRQALWDNNKAMWSMLEERRMLQASIAHDLRNPIAIIQGYAQYLQINARDSKLSQDKIGRIADNLENASKRLEYYTESIRTLNQMEDMPVNKIDIEGDVLAENISTDFKVLADKSGISLVLTSSLSHEPIRVDYGMLYRVLENVYGNALRYAKSQILINMWSEDSKLCVDVEDDGEGFTEDILHSKDTLFLPTKHEDGHIGMGLAMSRLLCEKHDGHMIIGNNEKHSGKIKIIFGL